MALSEKTIIITIDKKGGSKIEAQGFDDSTCLKATKSVEEALGIVQDKQLKPEGHVEADEIGQGLYVGSKG